MHGPDEQQVAATRCAVAACICLLTLGQASPRTAKKAEQGTARNINNCSRRLHPHQRLDLEP